MFNFDTKWLINNNEYKVSKILKVEGNKINLKVLSLSVQKLYL